MKADFNHAMMPTLSLYDKSFGELSTDSSLQLALEDYSEIIFIKHEV